MHPRDSSACDLAADCGFVDQAHLTHEFQAFAGMTPQALTAAVLDQDLAVIDRS